jgi:hypothetical protein
VDGRTAAQYAAKLEERPWKLLIGCANRDLDLALIDEKSIVSTAVTAGNVFDGVPAADLLGDMVDGKKASSGERDVAEGYDDASYGTADLVEKIQAAGAEVNVKVQAPSPARVGLLARGAFSIDTKAQTARCPGGVLPIAPPRQ